MRKKDLVEALIISRLTGSITKEERLRLNDLLAKNFKYRRMYRRMKKVLTKAVIERLSAKMPAKVTFGLFNQLEDGFYFSDFGDGMVVSKK